MVLPPDPGSRRPFDFRQIAAGLALLVLLPGSFAGNTEATDGVVGAGEAEKWRVRFLSLPAEVQVGAPFGNGVVSYVSQYYPYIVVETTAPADLTLFASARPGFNGTHQEPTIEVGSWTPDDLHADQWGPVNARAREMWATTRSADQVIICVADSGVDASHEDIAGNWAIQQPPGAPPDSDADVWQSDDENGHGTHVAGIAAGVINNGVGMAGMGNAQIASYDIFQRSGADGVAACDAILHNRVIINMSWHTRIANGPGCADDEFLEDADLRNALETAHGRGRLLVGISHNCEEEDPGQPIFLPGAAPEVITVGAIDQTETRAVFSKAGPELDIMAPGVEIYSTLPGDAYASWDGTSMAAPHVSGALALTWSYYTSKGETLTHEELEDRLFNTTHAGTDPTFGHGILDAKCLLDYHSQCLPPPNDNYTNRQAASPSVLPNRVITSGDNWDATTETGEPLACGMTASVWYTTKPEHTNRMGVEFREPADKFFHELVAVYEEGALDDFSDDQLVDCGAAVEVPEPVVGTNYSIMVAGAFPGIIISPGHEEETGNFSIEVFYYPKAGLGWEIACLGEWSEFWDGSSFLSASPDSVIMEDVHDGGHQILGPVPYGSSFVWFFDQTGVHDMRYTVIDDMGRTDTMEFQVEVENCLQTAAAGDYWGGSLVATGNDPGCGLGAPDSFDPAPARLSVSAFLGLGGFKWGLAGDQLPLARHHHQAVTRHAADPGHPDHEITIAGGATDCSFAPRSSSFTLRSDGAGTTSWTSTPPMWQARIAPAAGPAKDPDVSVWAGGDATGGDPSDPSNWHEPTATVESFNGAEWNVEAPMPAGVIGADAAHGWYDNLLNEGLMVAGGYSHPQKTNRVVQVYDTHERRWVGPHLTDYLTSFASATCDERPIVIGGMAGEQSPMYEVHSSMLTGAIREYNREWLAQDQKWDSVGSLDRGLAHHHAAVIDETIYVFGGFAASEDRATNGFYAIPCASLVADAQIPPAVMRPAIPEVEVPGTPVDTSGRADGAMAPGIANLFVFGGTDELLPDGRPGCPTDEVLTIDPLLGVPVSLSDVRPEARLPEPTASMASAVLPDGLILLAGGRVQVGGNCYVPTDHVHLFDPVALAFVASSDPSTGLPGLAPLAKSLIAPSMAFSSNTVFVTGGDERGDIPLPATGTGSRPWLPNSMLWQATYGSGSLGGWIAPATREAPMGVVHGELLTFGGGECPCLLLVGGNHHPERAVRLGQLALQFPAPGSDYWQGNPLPEARAHHGASLCNGRLAVVGGVSGGTVYHTGPFAQHAGNAFHFDSGGDWQSTTIPFDRNHAVVTYVPTTGSTWMLTGTDSLDHRTADYMQLSLC